MLLVVDVGNTHTVLGLFRGKQLTDDFRFHSSRAQTIDECRVLLVNLLQLSRVSPQDIEGCILASVVPDIGDRVAEAIERAFEVEPLIVGPGVKTGVRIQYENPKEVGADRIVNAVAAYHLIQGRVIVVDFGTATTFDCIDEGGVYLGGAIAPGLEISAGALSSRAAKLPRVELSKPASPIGRNTTDSMRAGLIYGYVGLVDGLVERLWKEMGGRCPVLATGGLAPLIGPESETVSEIADDLTLEGLRLIYNMNR